VKPEALKSEKVTTLERFWFILTRPTQEREGVIIRENEYGTQELRREWLKIKPMWNRWSSNFNKLSRKGNFAHARPPVEPFWDQLCLPSSDSPFLSS
jgi:hypothetical protein